MSRGTRRCVLVADRHHGPSEAVRGLLGTAFVSPSAFDAHPQPPGGAAMAWVRTSLSTISVGFGIFQVHPGPAGGGPGSRGRDLVESAWPRGASAGGLRGGEASSRGGARPWDKSSMVPARTEFWRGTDATRLACRSSAKMVETSFVIRSRSRGWSLTRSQRDPLHPGFQELAPTK